MRGGFPGGLGDRRKGGYGSNRSRRGWQRISLVGAMLRHDMWCVVGKRFHAFPGEGVGRVIFSRIVQSCRREKILMRCGAAPPGKNLQYAALG